MAKVPPDLFGAPLRGVALKGVGYTRMWRGKLVWSSWPRSQPYPRTLTEEDARKLFAHANHATPYMESSTQLWARDVAEATTLNVRDLLIKSLYNRLAYLAGPDGRVIYSMASMIDVSGLLDVLGAETGAILIRDLDYWTVLLPGQPGEVLTVDIEGHPMWAPGGGGADAGAFWGWPATMVPLTTSSALFATKGTSVRALADCHVTHLNALWQGSSTSDTYEMAIAEWASTPGGAVGAILGRSLPLTGLSNSSHATTFELPDPVNLSEGTEYLIALSRTNLTGTSPVVSWITQVPGDVVFAPGPLKPMPGSYPFATTTLTSGTSPVSPGTGTYLVGANGALGLVAP